MPIDKIMDKNYKLSNNNSCDGLLFKVNIRIDEHRSAKVEFSNSDSIEKISEMFCSMHQLDAKRKRKIEKLLINLKNQYVDDI